MFDLDDWTLKMDERREALQTTCGDCSGDGRVPDEESLANGEFRVFMVPCPTCRGEGVVDPDDE